MPFESRRSMWGRSGPDAGSGQGGGAQGKLKEGQRVRDAARSYIGDNGLL